MPSQQDESEMAKRESTEAGREGRRRSFSDRCKFNIWKGDLSSGRGQLAKVTPMEFEFPLHSNKSHGLKCLRKSLQASCIRDGRELGLRAGDETRAVTEKWGASRMMHGE